MNEHVVYAAVVVNKDMTLEKMKECVIKDGLFIVNVDGLTCNVVDVKQRAEHYVIQDLVVDFMVSHPNKTLRDIINPNAVIDKLSEDDFIDHVLFENTMYELLSIDAEDVD